MTRQLPEPVTGNCNAIKFVGNEQDFFPGDPDMQGVYWVRCTKPAGHGDSPHVAILSDTKSVIWR
jgi:hypothetical protein